MVATPSTPGDQLGRSHPGCLPPLRSDSRASVEGRGTLHTKWKCRRARQMSQCQSDPIICEQRKKNKLPVLGPSPGLGIMRVWWPDTGDPYTCLAPLHPGGAPQAPGLCSITPTCARDGGAWWASVYGVTQSQTRLKRLSSSSSFFLRSECRS